MKTTSPTSIAIDHAYAELDRLYSIKPEDGIKVLALLYGIATTAITESAGLTDKIIEEAFNTQPIEA